METVIPGIRMIHPEQRRWLRVHLVAGVTTFAVLMPQEMAYGELAGFAPIVGMHAAIGALARQCAFCEFTMSDDWFNGIFCILTAITLLLVAVMRKWVSEYEKDTVNQR